LREANGEEGADILDYPTATVSAKIFEYILILR